MTVTAQICSLLVSLRQACAQGTLASTDFFHPLQETVHAIDYATYTPGACLAAVQRTGALARRADAIRPDAWQQAFLENDTVLAVQRQTAQTCLMHLTLAVTGPSDLPDLARMYWFAGDTLQMQQVITRVLAQDTTADTRARSYFQLLTRFLLARQRDVALAEQRILPGLDSLNTLSAQVARVQVHAALAHTYAASRRPGSGHSAQVQIALALHSFAAMPAIMQTVLVDTVGPLFELGATEATERGDTTQALTLLADARRSLARLPEGTSYVHNTEEVVRYFGMVAPAIHADRIYGAPLPVSPAGPWPRPGKWTLVASLPAGEYLAGFYRHLATVVHDSLGDSLDLVFVAATLGHWWRRGPLTLAEEGAAMYDFLTHRWRIPGTLLVEETHFKKLVDGRRVADPTITPGLYMHTGLVIDPHGVIRAMVQPEALGRFDLLLAALLRREAAQKGPLSTPQSTHQSSVAGRA